MKNFVKLVVIVAVLGVGGKFAYDFVKGNAALETAETRIRSMLGAMERANEQEALCQWAVGKPIMPSEEMGAHTDRFDRWRREHFMVNVRSWSLESIQQQGDRYLFESVVDGHKWTFVVQKDQPISIQED